MKNQLTIDSVFLDFGEQKILRGIHLNITEKEVVGILGRNGCGKSSFLKILIGFIQPQFKHISLNGTKIENLYQKKGLINYLSQHEFHPKHLTVKDLLTYYDIDKEHFYKNYSFLKEVYKRKFGKLSGGIKRLVEVLLVLESNSAYTILDEPFSHIMPIYIDLVKDVIERVKQRKSILITDHQYKNVMAISDKLFLLKSGILYSVTKEEDLREKGYII